MDHPVSVTHKFSAKTTAGGATTTGWSIPYKKYFWPMNHPDNHKSYAWPMNHQSFLATISTFFTIDSLKKFQRITHLKIKGKMKYYN
jgi:hypothetical protein